MCYILIVVALLLLSKRYREVPPRCDMRPGKTFYHFSRALCGDAKGPSRSLPGGMADGDHGNTLAQKSEVAGDGAPR